MHHVSTCIDYTNTHVDTIQPIQHNITNETTELFYYGIINRENLACKSIK